MIFKKSLKSDILRADFLYSLFILNTNIKNDC